MKISSLITEKQFQAQVIDMAKIFKWTYYYTYSSKRSPAGFPDLVLVREKVMFRELKTDKGRVSPAQKAWGVKLADAGSDFAVWRPSMLDEIYKELR